MGAMALRNKMPVDFAVIVVKYVCDTFISMCGNRFYFYSVFRNQVKGFVLFFLNFVVLLYFS